jgi:hypothetical protein
MYAMSGATAPIRTSANNSVSICYKSCYILPSLFAVLIKERCCLMLTDAVASRGAYFPRGVTT